MLADFGFLGLLKHIVWIFNQFYPRPIFDVKQGNQFNSLWVNESWLFWEQRTFFEGGVVAGAFFGTRKWNEKKTIMIEILQDWKK